MLCLGSGSGKEEKEKRAEEKRRKKEPSRIPCASASVRAGQRQDKKEEKSGNPPLPCFAKTAWFHVEGEHAKKRKQREKEKGQTDSRYGPLALYILQVQFPTSLEEAPHKGTYSLKEAPAERNTSLSAGVLLLDKQRRRKAAARTQGNGQSSQTVRVVSVLCCSRACICSEQLNDPVYF